MMTRYEYRGQPATGTMLVALNDSRPQMEIIQPLTGASIYRDWLDQRGEGLHHVAAIVESVDAFVATASQHGIDVISRGEGFGVDDTGKYAYFDTQAALGMILEAVEPPSSLGEPLRRL
jgi:methylmalonyl-CoA/ethylmalonyl-CoA epimerase